MPPRTNRSTSETRATLRLAGPVVAAQLGQMSMGLTDTVMVGRLGPESLAGVALGNAVFYFFAITCMGVVMAVGPMVSQAYGAEQREPIERTVRQGFWLGLLLTLPAFFVIWNIGSILTAFGQPALTVAGAVGYLRAIVWGFLPFLWLMVLRGFVEGISRPWPVTIMMMAGVIVNVIANYVLIYGKLGFPALGIVGTGLASTTVFWFIVLSLTAYIRLAPPINKYRIFQKIGRPDPGYFKEIFRIGWPIGVSLGIEHGLFTFTALLLGLFGSTALAAHQVALQCAAFTFMVPLGIGMASSVRVGQAVGRNDGPGVRRAGLTGVGLAALFMSAAAACFLIFPRRIVGFFLNLSDPQNADVIPLAVTLLGIAAVFQLFDGIQVSAAGALRGLKDTRRPMLIGFFSYWLVGLTSGCVMGFILGMEAPGLWWGLVLGLATAAVLLLRRFHRLTRPITSAVRRAEEAQRAILP